MTIAHETTAKDFSQTEGTALGGGVPDASNAVVQDDDEEDQANAGEHDEPCRQLFADTFGGEDLDTRVAQGRHGMNCPVRGSQFGGKVSYHPPVTLASYVPTRTLTRCTLASTCRQTANDSL